MEEQVYKQNPNLLPALGVLLTVIAVVAIMGWWTSRDLDTTTQGEVEVTEYRVSSKVPGRIYQFCVSEGDFVHAGDTLAFIEAPDVKAKLSQAEAAESAAAAQSRKAENGARKEQITGAYEMWQKSKAALDVMEKSYARIKNLYAEGVVSAQKHDEVKAQLDAAIATEKAAKSQYDMAMNGAQQEDKDAAAAVVRRAQGAVSEVNSYIAETVLIAQHDGEVTQIYPNVGELVGTGAPIMSIAMMDDIWVTLNVREDHLSKYPMNSTFMAMLPALGKDKTYEFKVYYVKDLGTYAAWKATKTTGQFDMKTFEVKARPIKKIDGLRPGMSVVIK